MMHGTQGAGYPSLCEGQVVDRTPRLRRWTARSVDFYFPFAFRLFFSFSIERAILIYIVSGLCACNY